MQVLEDRIPLGARELVDAGRGGLHVARARLRPAREQHRHEIGDRSAHRLIDVLLRGRVVLLLQRAHADHEARDAVGLVGLQDLFRELHRLVDVAVGERGDERAVEQLGVLRILTQRGAIERGGGAGVALGVRMARGQIVAGHRRALAAVDRGELHHAGADRLGLLLLPGLLRSCASAVPGRVSAMASEAQRAARQERNDITICPGCRVA